MIILKCVQLSCTLLGPLLRCTFCYFSRSSALFKSQLLTFIRIGLLDINFDVGYKVDREDHFQRPGFLHIIVCVSLGYKVSNFVKNWVLPTFKKPQNLKGLTMNLVLVLFKQCSHVQICLLFCRTKPYG